MEPAKTPYFWIPSIHTLPSMAARKCQTKTDRSISLAIFFCSNSNVRFNVNLTAIQSEANVVAIRSLLLVWYADSKKQNNTRFRQEKNAFSPRFSSMKRKLQWAHTKHFPITLLKCNKIHSFRAICTYSGVIFIFMCYANWFVCENMYRLNR